MTQKLADLPLSDLRKLITDVKKNFSNRDTLWGDRRKVRFRQMDQELLALPLSNRAGANRALMVFQTEEPNQEVHRRVKRLVSNKIRVEALIYDTNDEQRQLAQDIKDALKALYKWMNRGKTPPERLVVEHQQADGLGVFKLDFLTNYAADKLMYYDLEVLETPDKEAPKNEAPEQAKARHSYQSIKTKLSGMMGEDGSPKYMAGVDLEPTAYKQATDAVKRTCDPPFRLSSVDPLAILYRPDGDGIPLVIESGKRSLNALVQNLSGYGVRVVDNRLVQYQTGQDATSNDTIPENESVAKEYHDLIDYTEIRTRQEVVLILAHPKLKDGTKGPNVRDEDDAIIIGFENPFGPYSTGYVFVPGDITGSHDPAHEYQPPILGSLSVAQPINVLTTIRLSAAIDAALRGKYIKMNNDAQPAPQLDQSKADKTPGVKDGKEVAMIPGEVKREEAPNIDLDKAEQQLAGIQQGFRFNEVLAGDASSSDSGHKLAIQVSQADTQLVPYQNARAEATVELLMCCLYAAKKLGQTIYVKETPDQEMIALGKNSMMQPTRAITPEMFDLDFNLVVTIGSETPVTKFAKWSALESRYKGGTLSLDTLLEQSDVENPADEIARIFEGQMLVGMMQQSIPVLSTMMAQEVLQAMSGSQQPPGEGGNESGGGMSGAQASTPIAGVGRVPGVGMSPGGPVVSEDGPHVQEGAGDGQVGRS